MPARAFLGHQTDRHALRRAEDMIACGELVASQQREVVAAVVAAGGDPARGRALLAEMERTLAGLVAWRERTLAKPDAGADLP